MIDIGAPATILIVDDEIQNRRLLEALLQPEGYATLSAANGEEALALIAQRAPDLVLLDVMMPGMNGFQVASAIKGNPATSNIPIIMVTASVDRNSRLTGLDSGAEDFLNKPVDRAELWLRVRNLLRLKAYGDFLQNHSLILEQQVRARTESLCASELRFRQIAENIHDVFFLQNLDGSQIYYVSPAYEKIWGRTCDSLYANPKSWVDSIHPDDLHEAFTHLNEFQDSEFDYEFRIVRPDGDIRWIYIRGFPILNDAGKAYRMAGIASDVTQRKQVLEEMHESGRRFRDLLRNVQLASVMLDCDARITFCNEYLLHLTGWRLEQVVGRNWFELFIPAQAGDAKDSFARLLANVPDAWLRENEILTRSGGRRLMRWNNSVLRSGAGDVIGSASIGEDITEQKQAEGRIKQLNRVYAVLSGINTLIVRVSDRDELFREACRIAIDAGGFRVALISITDRSAKKIVPVASAARDENLLTEIKGILASAEDSPNTMIARAVGEKKAIVSNDSQRDPRVMSGRQYAESGICSMAVLPLMVSGDAVGTLALYAAETGFFGEEEMRLLTELTGDIAFAIDHIDKQDRLNYLAYYDSVTELPNRTLFHETLKKTLAQAAHGWLVAVMCIDVDFFKNVNDTLGHAIGDELLRQFGGRLVKSTRKRDTIGRLGGDEFALILLLQDAQEAVVLVNKIRDALREPFNLSDNHVTVTASIGITLHPDDASDPETLVKYADTAMYRAKQAGRDTFRFFTAQMNSEVMARLDLEAALRNAVANDEFVLYYQPKVELKTGRIAGLEALLRWERPGHGLVSPQAFIPALESTGLILQVGSWVIAAACRQIGLWTRSSIGPVQVSVNVSGRQFSEGDLHSDVVKALGDNEISGELLELELTESSLMANIGNTIASLQSLKKRGVQVSIDDFGTGYSSLAYLRRFPIDKLKIDIAFVRDVTSTPDDASIVQAIIRMAHSLKLLVIAEGVETPGQLAYLRSQGCDEIQGYYFSPPLPAMDVEKMLREQKRLPARDDEEREPVKTLLLVDDEARVLASLQRALRREGYHILVAQSAAEGFELLAQHPVHVILCDQRMPNMSGTVFLDRVKDLYPGTLRIVLSGYTDLESIIDAINRGAIYRFYTKPWNNKALRDNIREAFRHHQLLQAGSDKLDAAISPNRSSPPLQTGTVDQAS